MLHREKNFFKDNKNYTARYILGQKGVTGSENETVENVEW